MDINLEIKIKIRILDEDWPNIPFIPKLPAIAGSR